MGNRLAREERGQATLEAALVFPILLILVIGMVGVALILQTSTITVLAATRGARVGAEAYGTPTLTPEEQEKVVKDAVKAVLGTSLTGTEGVDYTIEVTPTGQDIQVKVTYTRRLRLPWIKYILGEDAYTVEHQAVYRIEPQ